MDMSLREMTLGCSIWIERACVDVLDDTHESNILFSNLWPSVSCFIAFLE
jgi:hypothetical protein